MEAVETTLTSTAQATPKRLNLFERYLTAWVGLCMVVGVLLGKALPGMVAAVRDMSSARTVTSTFPSPY
jgi:ACR3 family arsenite transporter